MNRLFFLLAVPAALLACSSAPDDESSDTSADQLIARKPSPPQLPPTRPPMTANCVVTGCSGQLCAGEHVPTTCEWRPEYACYQKATCERGSGGECGWLPTQELADCLEAHKPPTNEAPCVRTGCSGQICADGHVATTCEWREEYACYQSAVCERTAGKCGWRATDELKECIANAGTLTK